MPTIVYYVSKELKFGTLIGSFNKDTIQEHETRLLSGRLSLQLVPQGESNMILQDGCAKETLI